MIKPGDSFPVKRDGDEWIIAASEAGESVAVVEKVGQGKAYMREKQLGALLIVPVERLTPAQPSPLVDPGGGAKLEEDRETEGEGGQRSHAAANRGRRLRG